MTEIKPFHLWKEERQRAASDKVFPLEWYYTHYGFYCEAVRFSNMIEAGKIDKFRGPGFFLSNFDRRRLQMDNVWYRSREHGFQALKFLDPVHRSKIIACSSPAESKSKAKELKAYVRPDWYQGASIHAMQTVVHTFFQQWPDKCKLLLLTKDCYLEEGNNWGDVFWGTVDGVGENWLGRILMWTRTNFRTDPNMPVARAMQSEVPCR